MPESSMGPLSRGTKAALKQLQPFYRVPATNPLTHPLFRLRVLNNRDKHRRLNLLARNVSVLFVNAQREPIYEGGPVATRIAESYEGDTYTARLTVDHKLDVDGAHPPRL